MEGLGLIHSEVLDFAAVVNKVPSKLVFSGFDAEEASEVLAARKQAGVWPVVYLKQSDHGLAPNGGW